ncbi:MAG: hypothetical protein JXB26_07980 [Candidatus Aminicenantes bacterium]|nr:hypothetical protein [Candidatus Aminicenantes bacterium]
MKKFLFILFLFLSIIFLSAEQEEGILKIDIKVSPYRLAKGQEGKVVLKLDVEEGISINPQPSFIIEFEPADELIFPKDFYTASDLEIKISKENGREFLIFSDPVEIPFTMNLEAKPGKHQLKGKIKYFASCKEEEWCLKSSTEFKVEFYTRSRHP